jgi:hypothetical protein
MKGLVWNILTVLLLLGLCGMLAVMAAIFVNPDSEFNPFPPSGLPTLIVLPSSTWTPFRLPPTWTPEGGALQSESGARRPTQTFEPTTTGFMVSSYTPSPTITRTPTNTRTKTMTPTRTKTPTVTNTKKPSPTGPTVTKRPTKTRTPTRTKKPKKMDMLWMTN